MGVVAVVFSGSIAVVLWLFVASLINAGQL